MGCGVTRWVQGQAEEQEDQPETGSWGASVRGDQACVPCGACAGDYDGAGSREDGFRVFLLQLGAVGYSGGEVVAWAIEVELERGEDA